MKVISSDYLSSRVIQCEALLSKSHEYIYIACKRVNAETSCDEIVGGI